MRAIRERGGFVEFLVPDDLIEEWPEKVRDLLAAVVIVRAEGRFARRGVQYTAWSPLFTKTRAGHEPPRIGLDLVWQPFKTPDEKAHWRDLVSVKFSADCAFGLENELPTIVRERAPEPIGS